VKGYFVPAQLIAVSPIDVGGRVVELNVVEGKLFKKGDILAKLEDISYRAAVEEAKAALAGANRRLEGTKLKRAGMMPESVRKVEVAQSTAELREAEAQKERALDQLTRLEKLGPSASDQELRQAKFDYLGSEARVGRLKAGLDLLIEGPRQEQKAAAEADAQASEADVRAAEARLQSAEWRLNNCVIRAPVDGTVLTKKAEKFNLVNPQAFAGGSGSVCEMADLADLEVDLEIPERDIGKLIVGQPCRIKADAFPDRQYAGKLDRIMPTANRSRNIVNVRVKVALTAGEVPGTFLKPEMGAVVDFVATVPQTQP
jgi:HlyD family secretion protein